MKRVTKRGASKHELVANNDKLYIGYLHIDDSRPLCPKSQFYAKDPAVRGSVFRTRWFGKQTDALDEICRLLDNAPVQQPLPELEQVAP